MRVKSGMISPFVFLSSSFASLVVRLYYVLLSILGNKYPKFY